MVLIPEIGVLALALWCLAAALAITVVVEWLINAMGGVPVIGSVIKAVLSPVAHAISYAVGLLEHGIDALIGAAWSTMARITEWLWSQFVAQSTAILQIAHLLGNQLYSVTGLRSLVNHLEKVWHGIEHGVRDLQREYAHVVKELRYIEKHLFHGIGNDLVGRVKALEKEFKGIETDIQAGVATAEGVAQADVSALSDYIAKNFVSDAELATEAVAAGVLTAAGVGWLRCNSNPFNNNKNACGLWGDLANLLAIAAIDAATLASLYELIGIAQNVTPTVTGLASDLLQV